MIVQIRSTIEKAIPGRRIYLVCDWLITKNMKKTLLLLAALPLFTACYTTNDVFVPAPETSYKMSHELMLTTTLPLITIPQNVGFSYRLATPGIAGSQFSLNYFLRYERGLRRIQVEAEEIDGNRRIKSDNVKTVLMPTFQLGEDVQLGLGFGGNYVFGIDDGYARLEGKMCHHAIAH